MQLYQLKFPNGKSYIGITSKTVKERFLRHCAPSNNKNPCQKAIHKYGKENVVLTVLATVDNWELLCLAEIEAIEKFNTLIPNGYNVTLGGDGNLKINIFGDERIARDKSYIKEKCKEYYLANKKSISEYKKRWAIENKEKLSLSSKKRYFENIEDRKKKAKIYRDSNKQKNKIEIEKFQQTIPFG